MMKSFLYTLVALAVFGCGGKDPLSQQQKDRLMGTIESLGNVTTSVKQVDQRKGARNLLGALGSVVAQGDRRVDKMVSSLESEVEEGSCSIHVELPQQSFSSEIGWGRSFQKTTQKVDLKMQVAGERCPISMDLSFVLDASETGMKGSFDWQYEVLSEDFKELNDVDSLSVSGDFNIKVETQESESEDPWGWSYPAETKTSGGANIKGTIHSQKEGDVKFYLNMDVEGSSGTATSGGKVKVEAKLGLEYADFTGEFKIVQTANSKGEQLQYSLNGEELTEAEFNAYIDASGFKSLEDKSSAASQSGTEELGG